MTRSNTRPSQAKSRLAQVQLSPGPAQPMSRSSQAHVQSCPGPALPGSSQFQPGSQAQVQPSPGTALPGSSQFQPGSQAQVQPKSRSSQVHVHPSPDQAKFRSSPRLDSAKTMSSLAHVQPSPKHINTMHNTTESIQFMSSFRLFDS